MNWRNGQFYLKNLNFDLPFKNSDASQNRDPNIFNKWSDWHVFNAESVVIPMQVRAKCATNTLTEKHIFTLLESRRYTIWITLRFIRKLKLYAVPNTAWIILCGVKEEKAAFVSSCITCVGTDLRVVLPRLAKSKGGFINNIAILNTSSNIKWLTCLTPRQLETERCAWWKSKKGITYKCFWTP